MGARLAWPSQAAGQALGIVVDQPLALNAVALVANPALDALLRARGGSAKGKDEDNRQVPRNSPIHATHGTGRRCG